jgi:hypothetical protein
VNERKGKEYRSGELETILSLVPTNQNIQVLAALLDRSPDAIRIVYRIAYGGFRPSGSDKGIQVRKVRAAKKRIGIAL